MTKDSGEQVRSPLPVIDSEATADPIFLLQTREVQVIEPPRGWAWGDDCEYLKPDPDLPLGKDDLDYPTPEDWPEANFDEEFGTTLSFRAAQMRGGDNCIEHWRTERVFLTREEGEAYGAARHYNYPLGYRVYCTVAAGALADLLRTGRKIRGLDDE